MFTQQNVECIVIRIYIQTQAINLPAGNLYLNCSVVQCVAQLHPVSSRVLLHLSKCGSFDVRHTSQTASQHLLQWEELLRQVEMTLWLTFHEPK